MRRAVIIQSYEFFPDFRVSRDIDLLRRRNIECHAIVWQRTQQGKGIRPVDGVHLHRVLLQAKHGLGAKAHMVLQPRFMAQVVSLLRRIKPDLILAHNFECGFPAVVAKLLGGTSNVVYVSREPYHKVFRTKLDHALAEWMGWTLDALVGHLSKAVITVTPQMVRLYEEMGLKAVWIPNAPTDEFFHVAACKAERDRCVFGFVGNIRPSCGIEEMWRALVRLEEHGPGRCRMLLCGPVLGGFENAIARMRAEQPDLLTVMPGVAPEEVPALYNEIDVAFQLPENTKKYSRYGLNVKLYEAMAAATPVIVGRVSENPGFLQGVDACVLVDSHNEDELVRAAEGLLDPHRRAAMGKIGRNFVRQRFAWSRFVTRYESLLAAVERMA